MVITIEPGVEYEKGKMIVHEENVVVTSNGAETPHASRTVRNADRIAMTEIVRKFST